MSNVLSEEKKQQVIALGRLGWSQRRIQGATGIRRETCGQLSQSCRNRRSTAGRLGAARGKTGHRGDHRLWRAMAHLDLPPLAADHKRDRASFYQNRQIIRIGKSLMQIVNR